MDDLLNKYIYIDDDVRNKLHDCKCNKNFLVYVLTLNDKLEAKSETNQKTSKHSLHNAKESDDKKIENSPVPEKLMKQSAQSTSKLTNSTINQKPSCNLNDVKTEESETKTHKGYELFKKLIGLQKTKASSTSNTSIEELFVKEYSFNECSKDTTQPIPTKGDELTKYKMPTSFFEAMHPYLDYTMSEAMREVIDLSNRLQFSEIHIKDTILKYINDKNLEKDLISSICGHGKLLLDSERRALNLASETWLQQADIYKDQQKSLQNTLNSIVHQNRQLHEENETLARKNEKLSMKILLEGDNNSTSARRSTNVSISRFMEDLSKNNDKLRGKLNFTLVQMQELEKNLKKFQTRNNQLHDQLTGTTLQLQSSRALFEQTKADNEIETAKLMQELRHNRDLMNGALAAGDSLLNDLELLKTKMRNLKKTPYLCETTSQDRDKTVIDFIHLSRTYINELTNEIVSQQDENALLCEKNDKVQADNEKQSQIIADLQNANELLESKVVEIGGQQELSNRMKEKYTHLEEKLVSFEQLLMTKNSELDAKDEVVKRYENEITSLKTTVDEDKKCMEKLEMTVDSISKEKDVLQAQVNGMVEVLSASGAGEVTKELVSTQEKLAHLQQQFYAMTSEKRLLQREVNTNNEEKKTLIAYQRSCYDQLQVQLKEMEQLEKMNESLKEKLDCEKQTVIMLQSDRVKHLEERTVLTAIYDRLKDETSKVDQLETVLFEMNKKASRLAVIAEYNKQLGEKLKHEVAERDVAITELQNNVKELNDIQLESSREKVALCEELSQVFTDKEHLNVKLAEELEKNVRLDESNKELDANATMKLNEIQAIYLRERNTLKNLLKEMKNIILHRDVLNEQNNKYEEKIKSYENAGKLQDERIQSLTKMIQEKIEQINNLEEILKEKHKEMEILKANMKEKIAFHKNNGKALKDIYEQASDENVSLRKSVDCLEGNIRKLRVDLDTLKANEKEHKRKIEEDGERYNKLIENLNVKTFELKESLNENDELKKELHVMHEKFDQLLYEYEKMTNEANRFVGDRFSTTKKSVKSSDTLSTNYEMRNKRDEELIMQPDRIRELEEQIMELNNLVDTITKQRDSLRSTRHNIETDYKTLTISYTQSLQAINELEEKQVTIEDVYNKTVAELSEENKNYRQTIIQTTSDYDEKIRNLNSELEQARVALNEMSDRYEKQCEDKKVVDRAHKSMAFKMLRAVQLLIAEKVARENSEKSIKSLEEQMSQALIQKDQECEEKLGSIESELAQFVINYEKICKEKDLLLSECENRNSTTNSTFDESRKVVEAQSRIAAMKVQLDQSHAEILSLHQRLCNMESDCATLEFEKNGMILKLHETQGKVHTEKVRNDDLEKSIQNTLAAILRMREDGSITHSAYNILLSMVQNTAT